MKEKNILIKIFLCSLYLIIITVLIVVNYHIYNDEKTIVYFPESEKNTDYSYIDIYKMSEKFAYYKETNIGIHFVADKEDNIYIISINEDDYSKYKDIIDYSYEKITKKPKKIRVYGYPIITDKKLKDLADNNINKFTSNEDNIYNVKYLDTTMNKSNKFIIVLSISILSTIILLISFFITLLDKGKD